MLPTRINHIQNNIRNMIELSVFITFSSEKFYFYKLLRFRRILYGTFSQTRVSWASSKGSANVFLDFLLNFNLLLIWGAIVLLNYLSPVKLRVIRLIKKLFRYTDLHHDIQFFFRQNDFTDIFILRADKKVSKMFYQVDCDDENREWKKHQKFD